MHVEINSSHIKTTFINCLKIFLYYTRRHTILALIHRYLYVSAIHLNILKLLSHNDQLNLTPQVFINSVLVYFFCGMPSKWILILILVIPMWFFVGMSHILCIIYYNRANKMFAVVLYRVVMVKLSLSSLFIGLCTQILWGCFPVSCTIRLERVNHGVPGIKTWFFLTHWGRDKMAAVSQTTLSNTFSWMKMLEFSD